MESIIKNRQIKLFNDNPELADCRKCSKNIVCTLYRGISTLIMNNWQGDSIPFKPENVAMICKHYSIEFKENL